MGGGNQNALDDTPVCMSSPAPADNSLEGIPLSDLEPGEIDEQVERSETFLETGDGEQLFCQTWEADRSSDDRHGTVALMHGYGEHSSRYDHVASALVRYGYTVSAIDARGHGRSTGKRAHVESFGDYVRDFHQLVEWTEARSGEGPPVALGHSNGGLIALRHAQKHPDACSAYVLTSPMCGFPDDLPALKVASGRVLSRIWPGFSMDSEIDPDDLTHDSSVARRYDRDPLVLDVATARWFTESRRAQRELLEDADRLRQPSLFLVSGDDALTAPDATREVFDAMASPDRELELYPDLYHELLNETEWRDIVRHIGRWLRRRDGAASRETGG